MLRAVIIDDEQSCIDRLRRLLDRLHADSLVVVSTARTIEMGIGAIMRQKPDVVFLDVQIGDATGFDLLRQLPAISCDVIFTTGYEKYAVQAFKFSAVDYLLKPVDPDDLQRAIGKLREKQSHTELSAKFDTLFHNLKTLEGTAKRISVPTLTGLMFLQVNDIIRCQADVNYTHLFLKDNQKLTVSKTLKEFEELLTDYNFFRVHNSHLINLAHVQRYDKGKGGTVIMSDHSEVEVAERRRAEFLHRLATL